MALIDDIKTLLRISSSAYDIEIADLISAAKSDLDLAGVLTTDETDALYKRAISIYCKANFGYDNKDADRQTEAYINIKRKLMLALEYSYFTVTFAGSEQTYVKFNGCTKETDDSGTVVFYSRTGNHIPYSIAGGSDLYIDVTENTSVSI